MNREVDYSSLMLRVEGLVIAASIGLIGGLELGSLGVGGCFTFSNSASPAKGAAVKNINDITIDHVAPVIGGKWRRHAMTFSECSLCAVEA
jgi:hypothetical protein